MSEPEHSAARRSVGSVALRLGLLLLGAAAFYFALRDASWSRTQAMVARIGPPALLIALPQGLAFVLHGSAWQLVLGALGVQRSPASLISLVAGAEAVRMTFPGGPAAGDTMSVWLLKIRHGIDLGDALSSVATKKLLVVITNAIYAAIALVLLVRSPRAVPIAGLGARGIEWLLGGWIVVLAVTGAAMVVGMTSGALATRFGRLVARVPIGRVQRWAAGKRDDWRDADAQLAQPVARDRLGALVVPSTLLLGQWFLEAVETWLILHLIDADIGLAAPFAIEACAGLLRSAAFAVPGALGVQDAGYVAMLAGFGVPDAPSAGAAFVLLKRAKEVVWITTGYVVLVALGATPRVFATKEP